MGALTALPPLSSKLKQPSLFEQQISLFPYGKRTKKKNLSIVPVARLFGPAIFEASKLKVLFLGVDERMHPGNLPRTYTLTHSDITSKLTLAISQTINNSQVLEAFFHGDGNLFKHYPELQESLIWVYFHSNVSEFNKVECWGPIKEAEAPTCGVQKDKMQATPRSNKSLPQPCQENCECCFPPMSLLTWSEEPPRMSESESENENSYE
ncbi:hypothetical protein I3760_12G097700 [Carya illinoinensis]|nr:hypothetical protein I3760_12G097700 [Carya illinoinensis]